MVEDNSLIQMEVENVSNDINNISINLFYPIKLAKHQKVALLPEELNDAKRNPVGPPNFLKAHLTL